MKDYTNVLYSSYMPILSAAVFDNTGKPYDVSRILTSDFLFDKEAYLKYSRVYLPITYVLAYTAQFAGLSALVAHTACWHGKDIWQQTKKSFTEDSKDHNKGYRPIGRGNDEIDLHSRLMLKYEEAPFSWYLLTFITMLAIGIFVVE